MTGDDDDDMIDDDVAMEEWLKLSEEQQEAQVAREMAEHNRWFDNLPHGEQIKVLIRSNLRGIKENRVRLSKPELCTIPFIVDLWRKGIRDAQVRLLKLRAYRSTGIYPGDA